MRLEFVDPDGTEFDPAVRGLAEELANAAEREIREYLPGLAAETTLRVKTSNRVIPQTGDLGASYSPGIVLWGVDPARGLEKLVRERLRPTLFHELHHQVRGWVKQGGEMSTTFMRGVVCEGLATAFERDAAGSQPPWGDYQYEVRTWVEELLVLPVYADYAQWMFMHPDGRQWVGYRSGTFIADEATRRSGRSAADLVNASTEEVLELAGYA